MRRLHFLFFFCLASQPSMANEAYERLKAKYQALQNGQLELPSLSASTATTANQRSISNLTAIPSGEELILEIQLGKLVLGQVFGFKTDQGVKLSLSDMSSAFDFVIESNIENNSASGWVRNPNNTFELQRTDNGDWSVLNRGSTTVYPNQTIQLEDDFYVDLALYQTWFDLNFDVNYSTLVVETKSNTPLPIEQKLAREQRSKDIYQTSNTARAPLLKHDYQPISKPLIDMQGSVNVRDSDTSHSLSVLGTNDIAYFNTQYYFAIDENNDIDSAHLSGSRYSLDNNLLGPLKASTVEFGDIRPTQINTLESNNLSIGARVSNKSLTYNGGNSVNLIGSIQAGWDVEVYRNQLLINSQINVSDGQYEFQNIPLVFGYNEIELVFYGPQGQVNRETRDYYVSSTGQSEGEFIYDISLINEGERLIDQNLLNNNEDNGLSTLIRVDYGITDWWSVNLGSQLYHQQGVSSFDKRALGTEVSLFGSALLSLDTIEEDNGDYDRRYQIDTSLLDQSISFTTRDYQATDQDGEIDSFESQELRLSGSLPSLKLSYQQSFEQIKASDNEEYVRLINQLGANIKNSYLSNRITWSSRDDAETVGDWQIQRYLNEYFVRLGNNYSVSPEFDINSFFAEISGEIENDVTGRIRFLHDFDTQSSETALITSWQPNEFSITSNLIYNERTGWRASLLGRVGIGLSQDNNAFFTNKSLSSQSTLSARVFFDKNNNGRFDKGDSPLENVEVETTQNRRRATTNSQGVAILTSLPSYQKTDIKIDLSKQEEGFLIRADEGVSIAPRPGALQTIDIPVVQSLEIEGYAQELQRNGDLINKARVPILLKDLSGKTIKEVTSEFDGYFLITEIVPQPYTLEIDPAYLSDFSYQLSTSITLNGTETGVLDNQNLTLRKAFELNGFSAELASFSHIESLRGYWKILTHRFPNLIQRRYFYSKTESGYQLYVGFDEEPKQANSICAELTAGKVTCSVKAITRR